MNTKQVDIGDFDAVTLNNKGFTFELMGLDGVTGTGVHVTVQGKHADEVFKWQSATVAKATQEVLMANRSGKQPKVKSMEDLRDQNVEGAAIRVTGWSGPKQTFDRALLKSALMRNPHWIDQIIEESDNMGNFTPTPSSNSESMLAKSSD